MDNKDNNLEENKITLTQTDKEALIACGTILLVAFILR
jgi:hypothetical protein